MAGLLAALLAGCDEEEKVAYDQYNAEGAVVAVDVGVATRYVASSDPLGACALPEIADTGAADSGADTAAAASAGDTGGADTGTAGTVPEVASVVLTSNTGAVTVGVGCVTPSAGPLGTVHAIRVELYDAYAEQVDKAQVTTASGDRGKDTYDLVQDSTGEGIWLVELESEGSAGETRSDELTFRLFAEEK
jgi:hypothetical protein